MDCNNKNEKGNEELKGHEHNCCHNHEGKKVIDGHEHNCCDNHNHDEKKVIDVNEGITTFELGDELHKFEDTDEVYSFIN